MPRPVSDPLIYDQAAFARADHLVIGIPGALSPVRVMAPLKRLATQDRAVAFYRLPGFDGRPADEFVNMDFAAAHIVDTVGQGGFKRVDLVGHSTGSAIAIEAAKALRQRIPQVDVRVAAISTALPAPQPVLAGARGALGTVGAAARAGSLSPRKVWLEYYRTLAYGPNADTDPQIAQAADALVTANEGRISLPQDGLARRHTRALRRWTNPAPETLQGVEITLYHGAVDPVFPPRAVVRFADTLPRADVQLIDAHGHLLMLTYPEVWSRITSQLNR
ncbi:alpha/beta hydrolase [uncultured Tateyamaria sp.]|uniref:alpha/beta fold hydrolase n=1 Tax=Tateyamaria sp. 1078 TaxID=3417464 RepID=UPI002630057F|nr:alpha/beta hydrolase [uncultured Tateyamaria sp.]